MKTLYIMRHGQTLFNLHHKIQGWCDSPLTDLGIKQALHAKQYFIDNDIHFDSCYASTSERASDTLEIIIGNNKPYARLKGLKEWNFGRFEGQDESLNPPLPYKDFFYGYGGEKELDFQARINDTISKIADDKNGHNILIVTHGAALAQFYRRWEQHALVKKTDRFYNCFILKYEYNNKIFALTKIINKELHDL